MQEAITFSDVLIKPKYSEVESRRDVDLTSDFGKFSLKLPIISANMKTITGPKMAAEMSLHGAMGILHRFNSVEQAVLDYKEALSIIEHSVDGLGQASPYRVGVSIGVQDADRGRFDQLYSNGARVFCIDIAFGHSLNMKNTLRWIKGLDVRDIYIIAGNVATGEACYDLADWGANSIKVGIGGGKMCTTRIQSGIGVPQLHAIMEAYEEFKRQGIKNTKIISDGGINHTGDITKALKYCDAVMVGSYLSGCTENPGQVFKGPSGQLYKVYAGSASGENKSSNGQTADYIEGIASQVPFRGHVKYILQSAKEGIQSGFSYVGAKNLSEFKENCEFIIISDGGRMESKL